MAYVNGEPRCRTDADRDCTFCGLTEAGDEESLLLHRGRHAYVVLNRYPYNNGHLMVGPYRHTADYTRLSTEELLELVEFTRRAIDTLRDTLGAQGFNVGMNLGEPAGAGIPHHLHQHVVPRWVGDNNFMPVLGRTRVLPHLLEDTWSMLLDAWVRRARPEEEAIREGS